MDRHCFKFKLAGILIVLALTAFFGAVVMVLWNVLVPQIFGLPRLNYPQAAGILVLAKIFFGFRGPRAHEFHYGGKLRKKWMNMSEEERKAFVEKEKDFFTHHRRFSSCCAFPGEDAEQK